jgi:hypothetical protein
MRFFLFILILSALGCSTSETSTPTSYGIDAGKYFNNQFRTELRFSEPNHETMWAIADYCATRATAKGLEMNWTRDKIHEFVKGCVREIEIGPLKEKTK